MMASSVFVAALLTVASAKSTLTPSFVLDTTWGRSFNDGIGSGTPERSLYCNGNLSKGGHMMDCNNQVSVHGGRWYKSGIIAHYAVAPPQGATQLQLSLYVRQYIAKSNGAPFPDNHTNVLVELLSTENWKGPKGSLKHAIESQGKNTPFSFEKHWYFHKENSTWDKPITPEEELAQCGPAEHVQPQLFNATLQVYPGDKLQFKHVDMTAALPATRDGFFLRITSDACSDIGMIPAHVYGIYLELALDSLGWDSAQTTAGTEPGASIMV